MKMILVLLGLLISLVGILPLIQDKINVNYLDFIPVSGIYYNIVIVILGLLVVYFSAKGKKKKKNE